MSVSTNPQLNQILQRSAQMHAEIDVIWEEQPSPVTKRGTVVLAYCAIVRQHVLGQHQLLSVGLDVTAMTLVRPSYESLVRALWSLAGAQDEWIDRFLAPPSEAADLRDETITGPPVESMLATIKTRHPLWVFEALSSLKEATWKPMHSYVHGGIRPVVQALAGCPEPQQISVAKNANGFLMFATNVRRMDGGARKGAIAEIQSRFADCLPPLAAA